MPAPMRDDPGEPPRVENIRVTGIEDAHEVTEWLRGIGQDPTSQEIMELLE